MQRWLTRIFLATWAVVIAFGALGCSTHRETAASPDSARWTLTDDDRARLAADVEGTWITSMIVGDAITVTTELRLDHGHATELRRTTSSVGPSAADPIAEGHYTITASGALDLVLQSRDGERHTSSSISLARGWPGARDPRGEYLLVDAYRPRASEGRAFGFEHASATSGRIVVAVAFTRPLASIVAGTTTCVVEVAVHTQRGSVIGHASHSTPCQRLLRPELGLVEIVLAKEAESETLTALADVVDRRFYVDPKNPDVLLRASIANGPRSAWLRDPGAHRDQRGTANQ